MASHRCVCPQALNLLEMRTAQIIQELTMGGDAGQAAGGLNGSTAEQQMGGEAGVNGTYADGRGTHANASANGNGYGYASTLNGTSGASGMNGAAPGGGGGGGGGGEYAY